MSLQHKFHLKLSCKKISSGKCQVRFQAKFNAEKQFYGYFLTSPDDTLKDVVKQLNHRLDSLEGSKDPLHSHLYSIGQQNDHFKDFIIFKSKLS